MERGTVFDALEEEVFLAGEVLRVLADEVGGLFLDGLGGVDALSFDELVDGSPVACFLLVVFLADVASACGVEFGEEDVGGAPVGAVLRGVERGALSGAEVIVGE